jgi:hypothetical protein
MSYQDAGLVEPIIESALCNPPPFLWKDDLPKWLMRLGAAAIPGILKWHSRLRGEKYHQEKRQALESVVKEIRRHLSPGALRSIVESELEWVVFDDDRLLNDIQATPHLLAALELYAKETRLPAPGLVRKAKTGHPICRNLFDLVDRQRVLSWATTRLDDLARAPTCSDTERQIDSILATILLIGPPALPLLTNILEKHRTFDVRLIAGFQETQNDHIAEALIPVLLARGALPTSRRTAILAEQLGLKIAPDVRSTYLQRLIGTLRKGTSGEREDAGKELLRVGWLPENDMDIVLMSVFGAGKDLMDVSVATVIPVMRDLWNWDSGYVATRIGQTKYVEALPFLVEVARSGHYRMIDAFNAIEELLSVASERLADKDVHLLAQIRTELAPVFTRLFAAPNDAWHPDHRFRARESSQRIEDKARQLIEIRKK